MPHEFRTIWRANKEDIKFVSRMPMIAEEEKARLMRVVEFEDRYKLVLNIPAECSSIPQNSIK